MAYPKATLLDKACEIVKAYAAGGGKNSPEIVLRYVYEELKKLNEDTKE
jgi:hypothetical protein